MAEKLLVVVQGMFHQADSIAYDATFQFRALRALGFDVEVFAERFDRRYYPDVPARPVSELAGAIERGAAAVVYHWVDGWPELDRILASSRVPTVVRWHNNTPPWFFAAYSPKPTRNTVRGFTDLLSFADEAPSARFWVNSEFSRRQLVALGVDADRSAVVFPASHDLEHGIVGEAAARGQAARSEIRLLFVGRVVPHKGHRHVLAAAHALKQLAGRPVRVVFPGRADPDMALYPTELSALAARLGIALETPGEVSQAALARAYEEADVFVGLSEHEGFGLPILEAMARGLPVVGLRTTAVAEILADHPLACDDLDPVAVARRILALVATPELRRAIVTWQRDTVLPRYAKAVAIDQLCEAARALGLSATTRAQRRIAHESPPPGRAAGEALAAAEALPLPGLDVPRDLPRDIRDHFVTRYDLEAYGALLRGATRGDIRARALDLSFGSHRPVLGSIMTFVKRMILRLQDGLVRTIEFSHEEIERDIADLSAKIDRLSGQVAREARSAETASEVSESSDSSKSHGPQVVAGPAVRRLRS